MSTQNRVPHEDLYKGAKGHSFLDSKSAKLPLSLSLSLSLSHVHPTQYVNGE